MKKKFKDTLIGKILLKKIPKHIPIVGDIISNIENKEPQGTLDKKELPSQLIRTTLLIVIVYLVMKGVINWEEAEQIKGFTE